MEIIVDFELPLILPWIHDILKDSTILSFLPCILVKNNDGGGTLIQPQLYGINIWYSKSKQQKFRSLHKSAALFY